MIDGIKSDDKIIAVLESDAVYGSMKSIADSPVNVVERLKHYFRVIDESERAFRINLLRLLGSRGRNLDQ